MKTWIALLLALSCALAVPPAPGRAEGGVNHSLIGDEAFWNLTARLRRTGE